MPRKTKPFRNYLADREAGPNRIKGMLEREERKKDTLLKRKKNLSSGLDDARRVYEQSKQRFEKVESAQISRLPHLEKWFVDIIYRPDQPGYVIS